LISVYKKLGEVDVASKEEALRLEREKAVRGLDAESESVTTALNNLTYIIRVFIFELNYKVQTGKSFR
jgi:hypothetical protein